MFDRIHKGLWWDKPWSLVEGCTPVSPACDHCWLRGMNQRFGRATEGVRAREDRLEKPLRRKKPTAWAIWSDLFHDAVPPSFIASAFSVMARCPQHIFIVPTKRVKRMATTITIMDPLRPLPNVILMTTVEDQPRADERLPQLLRCKGWLLGLSCEPLLGPLNLGLIGTCPKDWGRGYTPVGNHIDWVIAGAESGAGRRPMKTEWASDLQIECDQADIPFFFKQAFVPHKTLLLNGTTYLEVPDVHR